MTKAEFERRLELDEFQEIWLSYAELHDLIPELQDGAQVRLFRPSSIGKLFRYKDGSIFGWLDWDDPDNMRVQITRHKDRLKEIKNESSN